MASVNLSEYEKAILTLNESIELHQQSQENSKEKRAFRDTCIQRFEFCIELAWKVSRKVMGVVSNSPNSVVREMAQDSLIEDPAMWLEFVEARNKSSHTYDEDIAKEVFAIVLQFPEYGLSLLEELKKR